MSKFLLTVLKNAIVPASIMIVGKVIGLYLAVRFLKLDMYIDNDIRGIFTVQLYFLDSRETMTANTIANSIMFLLLFSGTIIFFIKYYINKKVKNDPQILVKVIKVHMLSWVIAKEHYVLKMGIWGVFALLACTIGIRDYFRYANHAIVTSLFVLATVILLWLISRVYEYEFDKFYTKSKV